MSFSWITDSAAGATAYSCALRTYNRAIAVDPNRKPCGTLLEAMIRNGKKAGYVHSILCILFFSLFFPDPFAVVCEILEL